MAGAPHAAHHLVQNQQHAVAVANLADAFQIAGHRRHRARRCAHHRLGHKGHHALGAETLDLRLQLIGGAQAIGLEAFALGAVAVFVARRDMRGLDQHRRELRAPPFVAARGQRAQRVAVIALTARNHPVALRLADFQKILPGQFQCRFNRLGTARNQIDPINPFGGRGHQPVGQLFGGFRGEKAGMRKGQLVKLRMQRRAHRRV